MIMARTLPRVVLQVSRFPWGDEDPGGWLRDLALTADGIGFDGIALMDHLIQIPQVDRAWEPIPEPWVTLGMLAGWTPIFDWARSSRPSRFVNRASSPRLSRPWMRSATAAPSADSAPAGGCASIRPTAWTSLATDNGLINFRSASRRFGRSGRRAPRPTMAVTCTCPKPPAIHVQSATCRSLSAVPASGGRCRIVAEQADGCNLPSDQAVLQNKIDILHRHCKAAVGRDPATVEITVLDLPVIGTDRDDVAARVERLRGRLPAAVYAARHHAATAVDHARRYLELA